MKKISTHSKIIRVCFSLNFEQFYQWMTFFPNWKLNLLVIFSYLILYENIYKCTLHLQTIKWRLQIIWNIQNKFCNKTLKVLSSPTCNFKHRNFFYFLVILSHEFVIFIELPLHRHMWWRQQCANSSLVVHF